MKPHPRIRKTVKWGGAAIFVILACVWWWSGARAACWCGEEGTAGKASRLVLGILPGQFIVGSCQPDRTVNWPNGWMVLGHDNSRSWSFHRRDIGGVDVWYIPQWCVAAPVLAMCIWAWRLDILARRRESTGSCPACNYALAGLPAGLPCPECGRANPTEPTAASGDTAANSPQRHRDAEGSPS